MAKKFETREDLAAKINWEGDVLSAVDYGITADEMPDDELRPLWLSLETKYWEASEIASAISEILEEHGLD